MSLQVGDVLRMRNIPHIGFEMQVIRDEVPLEFHLSRDEDKTTRIVPCGVKCFKDSLRDFQLLDCEPLITEGVTPHHTEVCRLVACPTT